MANRRCEGDRSLTRRSRNQTGMRIQRRDAETAEISAETTKTGTANAEASKLSWDTRRKYSANSGKNSTRELLAVATLSGATSLIRAATAPRRRLQFVVPRIAG